MPVYNLLLSTSADMAQPNGNLIKPLDNSNKANVSWLVNWEGLFGADILRYKKCVMRYQLVSDAITNLTNIADNTGFIVVSGISSDKQSGNYPGTFLAISYPQTGIGGANTGRINIESLSNSHGVQVNIPSGISELGVRFYKSVDFSFQTGMVNYVLQLQFHLSNDIDS